MLNKDKYLKTMGVKKEKPFSCIEWTDKVFENIYWLPLTLYERPDADQLAHAIRYFLLHYAKGSGSVADWQNTLNILLLGLRETKTQHYILANEDARKEEKPKRLEFNMDNDVLLDTLVASSDVVPADMKSWYVWCLMQLQQQPEPEAESEPQSLATLAAYLGSHSLFLCKLITHNPENVRQHICEKLTHFCQRHLLLNVNEGRKTPAPSAELCETLSLVFERLGPYSKQIVCRLAHRRLEIDRTSSSVTEPAQRSIIQIQDVSCYDAFIQNGNGLLFWFLQASKKLSVSAAQLLDMLECTGEFTPVVEVLRNAMPKVYSSGRAEKTWQVCRLLRQKAYREWATNHPDNQLAVAAFVVIARDITACDDATWKQLKFKRIVGDDRNIQMGISIGQSIKRTVAFEKKHRQQTF